MADHCRDRRPAVVRLLRPRPQSPHPDPARGGDLVEPLRGHRRRVRRWRAGVRRHHHGRRVLRRLRDGEGAVGGQPVRLPRHHVQLQGAPRRPAEGTAVRHRVLTHRPHRVHPARRGAHQHLRLGLLRVRPDPAAHRGQPDQAGERGQPHPRQHHGPRRPETVPHHRHLRRRQALHRRGRQTGHDADAARHGRDRRHRHPLRARLHPRDLRPHPERLPRLHRHRVLPARPAPAVLPHRRPAQPAHLPHLRARRHPRLHRRRSSSSTPSTRTTSRSSTTANPSRWSRSAPACPSP